MKATQFTQSLRAIKTLEEAQNLFQTIHANTCSPLHYVRLRRLAKKVKKLSSNAPLGEALLKESELYHEAYTRFEARCTAAIEALEREQQQL